MLKSPGSAGQPLPCSLRKAHPRYYGYPVPAEGPDRYRNFVIPLNLEEDTWVNAIEFRPSAPSVVHHVLYFLDTSRGSREADAADPTPGYEGMGRSNGHLRYLGGWDLGTQPSKLHYELAWLLPANAGVKFVSAVIFLRSAMTGRGRAELGWFLWLGIEVASRLVGLVWRSEIIGGVQ